MIMGVRAGGRGHGRRGGREVDGGFACADVRRPRTHAVRARFLILSRLPYSRNHTSGPFSDGLWRSTTLDGVCRPNRKHTTKTLVKFRVMTSESRDQRGRISSTLAESQCCSCWRPPRRRWCSRQPRRCRGCNSAAATPRKLPRSRSRIRRRGAHQLNPTGFNLARQLCRRPRRQRRQARSWDVAPPAVR